MTRLAIRANAVNLAQGFPDFAAPAAIKEAACAAINADVNQYSVTWGAKPLRDAIAARYKHAYDLEVDPDQEITVVCGATEGMISSLLGTIDPGDEVIVFEPYYENYDPDIKLCGATRKMVSLLAPDWSFDPDELRRAFTPKTRAIIINTPNNPTGKVFQRQEEMELIASLCQEFDALAITDEIYEYITYDGAQHIPMITLPGMRDRSILVNSMSKTFSVTGWRVGWVMASPELMDSIRKVHDFLTVAAASPLQQACAMAMGMDDAYFDGLSAEYAERKSMLTGLLEHAGFRCFDPKGAYYVMTDISAFGFPDDFAFAHHLLKVGVAGVPGSSFYANPQHGAQQMRFCFCKKFETLQAAGERLTMLRTV